MRRLWRTVPAGGTRPGFSAACMARHRPGRRAISHRSPGHADDTADVGSRLCLDAAAGTANGTALGLRTCEGGNNQEWSVR